MKKENIKELTDKELQDRLEQVQKEYVQEKIQHTISPLDNPAKITLDRKLIARLKTEIRARELKCDHQVEGETPNLWQVCQQDKEVPRS